MVVVRSKINVSKSFCHLDVADDDLDEVVLTFLDAFVLVVLEEL